MFSIRLYKITKKPNSTARPAGSGKVVNCLIKSDSSVIEPIVQIKTNPLDFNYCRIEDFNRYYFISDIIFSEGLWTLYLTCDVLASYKTEIGSTSLYVTRSSATYNPTLIDNYYPLSTNITINDTVQVDDSADTILTKPGLKYGYFVLGVKGYNNAYSDGAVYYVMTAGTFVNIVNAFYGNSGTTWWGNLEKGVINSLNKIDDYISCCYWYPTEPPNDSGSHTVYIGTYNTNVTAARLTESTSFYHYFTNTFTVSKHPQASRGTYLNYYPYSKYTLVDDYIGTLNLDPDIMKDATSITRTFQPDYTKATAKITIRAGTQLLYSTYVRYGFEIILTGVDVSIGSLISGAAATVGNFMVGNYAGALGAAAGIGVAAVDSCGNPGRTGATQTMLSFNLNVTFRQRFVNVPTEDNDNKGRPLCGIRTPSALGGYMECENPHIEISGTQSEADQINGYLARGFYYE